MPSASSTTRGPFQKKNRAAFVNFLLSKYEMYTGQVGVESYPYYLTLEPSDVCQLRCPTCVTGIENEFKRTKPGEEIIFRSDRTKLSPELFDALLEELGETLFLLTFYNFGEPLLNKNLPDFIGKAKALNIETDINTNLSLPLSDAFIDELLGSGLDYLFASIDGFSQETYQVHRVGGNLELVKNNLKRLASARDRLGLDTCIIYNFLVFSFNEHEIPATRDYCDELGIYFNVRDAFIHNPDWVPTYRRNEEPVPLREELELPAGFGRKQDDVAWVWSPLPPLEEVRPSGRCSWHYGVSSITAGGKVTPCCMIPHDKHDFGAVVPGHNRFADVWNNQLYRTSRTDVAGRTTKGPRNGETICTRCPAPKFLYHLYSLHDCKVIAQFQRLFEGSDPVLEQAFELFCRSRYGVSARGVFSSDVFTPPDQVLGTEDAKEIVKFVDFFEKNLTEDGARAMSPSRPRA